MKNLKQTTSIVTVVLAVLLGILGAFLQVNKHKDPTCKDRFPREVSQSYQCSLMPQMLNATGPGFKVEVRVTPNKPYAAEDLESCDYVAYEYLDTLFFDGSDCANSGVNGATLTWGYAPGTRAGSAQVTVEPFGIKTPDVVWHYGTAHGIEVRDGLWIRIESLCALGGGYQGEFRGAFCSGGGMVVVIGILKSLPGSPAPDTSVTDTNPVTPSVQAGIRKGLSKMPKERPSLGH